LYLSTLKAWALTICLAAFALLAFWSTAHAVLVLAALAPIASAIQILIGGARDGYTVLELSILVLLGTAALRAAARARRFIATPFDAAVLAFIALAVASCLAQMPMELLRAEMADSLSAVIAFLSRRYFDRPFVVVAQTMLLVEGAGLAAVIARTFAATPLAARLRDMVVVGGAAAAALNANRLLEVVLRSESPVGALRWALQTLRFNTQHGELNAAGSYFALVAILCCAQAGFSSARAQVHAGLLCLFGCALWVSGSRVAVGSALLGCAVVVVLRHAAVARTLMGSRVRVAVFALALLATFAGAVFMLSAARHSTIAYGAWTRLELLKSGARMLRDRPLLGVGTSQFYARFPQYASPELLHVFRTQTGTEILHENAHNQFMQLAAELGLAGVASFVLLLVLAFRPHAPGAAPWRTGLLVALAGFLLTCFAGHPLLTPLVAYPFWMVVGLAATGALPLRVPSVRFLARSAAVGMLLLAMFLPVRWRYERRDADLTDVSLGFSRWERDDDGTRFRWAGARSALFVASRTAALRLRLKSPDASPRNVVILLDDNPAARVVVTPGRWMETNLFFPQSRKAPAFRRLDLEVVGAPPSAARSLMVGRVEEVSR
jgi:O-antigen ligase